MPTSKKKFLIEMSASREMLFSKLQYQYGCRLPVIAPGLGTCAIEKIIHITPSSLKRKLLYVVPCPSLNIMLVFQACLLLLSARVTSSNLVLVSSSFPSYPKPNFKSLPLLNRNPSYLLCFYNSITILSSIPFTMAFLHILSLIFSIMEDALTSTKKMSHQRNGSKIPVNCNTMDQI